MAKRRPEHNLNHNNWDEELEEDEVGEFQTAKEDVLKNRVIRVAKRRLPRDQTDSGEPTKAATSVFSGFSFDKMGASGATGTGAASGTSASKPLFSFGNTGAAPFSFSSNSTATMSSAANSTSNVNAAAAKSGKSQQYKCKLKDLNKSVLNCIRGYVDGENLCILTPIFKDYEKFVKELEDDESKAATNTTSGAATNTATSESSQFKFSFASAKSTEPSASTSSAAAVASAPTASTPSFSFGKPAAVAPTSSPAAPSVLSGFSFASAAQQAKEATPTAAANGTQAADAEDEDDEPPKVEFVPVVEDDNIYSKRCKVFVKDDSAFKDRGTGTLYLKRVKDDKVQLIVRADTNLGNILLNIIVSEAIPATRNKNNLILVCIPTPEAEQKARQVLVRVKTEDDATELLEEYKKHQK